MRRIIPEDEYRSSVKLLGGEAAIEPALDAIAEPLQRNPEGFRSIDLWFGKSYYAITRRIRIGNQITNPLIFYFTIDDAGSVHLWRVEEYDSYI